MAVNVDTVYQKVLMFANKEQRGYITPQEFNLFAHQAQLEIFEQYFYDINFYMQKRDNSDEYSDIIDNLNEKIAIFEKTANMTGNSLAAYNFYRLGSIFDAQRREVEEVKPNELSYILNAPLTAPTFTRPIYVRTGETTITPYPSIAGLTFNYISKPEPPNWAYVVVNGKAMYDTTRAKPFELHVSEETELVYKILKYAGISMKRDDVASSGQGLEISQIQQEKS